MYLSATVTVSVRDRDTVKLAGVSFGYGYLIRCDGNAVGSGCLRLLMGEKPLVPSELWAFTWMS